MKLSISASTEKVSLPQIVFKGELETVFRQVQQAGYEAVDLFLSSTADEDTGRLKDLCRRYGVRIAMLSALGDLIEKDITLGNPDAGKREAFFREAPYHLEQAAELGAMVPVGFSRGRMDASDTKESYIGRLCESLGIYDELAGSFGVRLIVEPINRYEINSLNSVEEALEILKGNSYPNTGLLLDLFHMNIEEVSILLELTRAAGYLSHVHFSDSNRLPPGMGHTNLKDVYFLLKEIGYMGFLGIEVLPHPDPQAAAAFSREYLRVLETQAEFTSIEYGEHDENNHSGFTESHRRKNRVR